MTLTSLSAKLSPVATDILPAGPVELNAPVSEPAPGHFDHLAAVAVPLAVVDGSGRIVYLNPAAAALAGEHRSTAVGMTFWDALAPAAEGPCRRAIRRAAAGPVTPATDAEAVECDTASGRALAWQFAAAAAGPTAGDGRVPVVCTGQDRTAGRRLARSLDDARERVQALVEHSPDYVTFYNPLLQITWVSKTAAPLTPDDVVGRTDFDLLPPGDAARLTAAKIRVMRTGVGERVDLDMRIGDHDYRFEAALERRVDGCGRLLGTAAYVRDVTDRWRAERDVKALNETLEVRVAERTAAAEQHAANLIESERVVRLQKSLLEAVGEAAIDGVIVVSGEGKIMWSNGRFAEMWGVPQHLLTEGLDQTVLRVVLSQLVDPDAFLGRVNHLYAHPDEPGRDELVFRDGRRFDRYTAPVTGGPGARPVGRAWFFRDVTEQRQVEDALRASDNHHRELAERNRWLVREVEHRVGNHLAGLIGLVAAMRGNGTADVSTFAAAIDSRLRAMAHVHQLLTRVRGAPVPMGELVGTALAVARAAGGRPTTESFVGPDVSVTAAKVAPLTMILIEWYTNSCKYGAHARQGEGHARQHGAAEGRLEVTWERVPGDAGPDRVRLRWRERGGPPVSAAVKPSLGTALVHAFASRELGGSCELGFGTEGVEHVLEFSPS